MKRLSLAFIVSLGLLQMGCGAPTHFSVFVKEPSSVRVTIVDKRPDEQKSYRGPEALGEAKHIFGDSNFVPPLFEIVSADIQSSYSRVHTNEVLEISSLEIILYDPDVHIRANDHQYGELLDRQVVTGRISRATYGFSRLFS